MKYFIILASLLLLVFIGGCDPKNDTPEDVTPFQLSDFPVKVGNYWVYKKTDLRRGNIDTIKVEIKRKFTQAGEVRYNCNLTYGWRELLADSFKLSITDSFQTQFLPRVFYIFGDYKLKKGFNIGDRWPVRASYDMVNVASRSPSFSVGSKFFGTTFMLTRDFREPMVDILTDTLWVTKNVGVVKQKIINYLQNEKYELIDYKMN